MITSSNRPLCIKGKVWSDNTQTKTIIVDNGTIIKIYNGNIPVPDIPNLRTIELKEDEVVFPCLINLHTHIGYNILPIWNTLSTWKNRFQWRNNDAYLKEIKGLIDFIKGKWEKDDQSGFASTFISDFLSKSNKKEFAAFAGNAYLLALTELEKAHAILSEIQAVAGGTGLIQQTLKLDDEKPDNRTFVIRNTGNSDDLGIEANLKVAAIVDFYQPDTAITGQQSQDTTIWSPSKKDKYYENFIKSVNANNAFYYSTIVHIGEGRTGYLNKAQKDPYILKEIEKFIKDTQQDIISPQGLSSSNLTITHANGIDFDNPHTLKFLRDNHVSIIWSPVSNLLLYGDTLPIKKILDNGINVCLGSDWSPSGSKHVLDELKFAKFFTEHFQLGISSDQLFNMVTLNPVSALGGLRMGSLKEGNCADFFVLKKASPNSDPLTSLIAQPDSNIQFVVVNGRIVYGNEEIFKEPSPVDYQPFPPSEGVNASKKVISFNSSLNFNLETSMIHMDKLMDRYCTDTLKNPNLKRTRFLSSDDFVYQRKIDDLKQKISTIKPTPQ